MNYPKVFIIILNWNGKLDTLECIESVFKMEYPNFDVVIVDNGSTDDSVAAIKTAFPQVILIENKKNLGFTGGNNIAMHYAMKNGGDYIWLLNNDTSVDSNVLTKLIKVGEKDPGLGLISPILRFYYDPNKIQFSGGYINIDKQEAKYYTEIFPSSKGHSYCSYLSGAALLIKREVLERLGCFDERFFAYCEDTDFSIRATSEGYKCGVVHDCAVYHKDASSLDGGKSPYHAYITTRNFYLLWTKHLKGYKKYKYIIQSYFPAVLRSVYYSTKQNNFEQANTTLAACWNAINGFYGSWENSLNVPQFIRLLFGWHPIFMANLLEGNYKKLFYELMGRLSKKHLKSST